MKLRSLVFDQDGFVSHRIGNPFHPLINSMLDQMDYQRTIYLPPTRLRLEGVKLWWMRYQFEIYKGYHQWQE